MSKLDELKQDIETLTPEKYLDRIEVLWWDGYNKGIDDAADLLNRIDVTQDGLSAAIRNLKK